MSRTGMPSVLDREVDSRERDAFGHRHFADGLRSLIESERLTPPYSIGLLGGWGTGKSTIKALYLSGLADDAGGRRERIHTATFNAWRYADDVKRALLRQVYLEIGGSEENLKEKLFGETRRTQLDSRDPGAVIKETLVAWATPLIVVLALLAAAILISWMLMEMLGVSSGWSRDLLMGLLATLVVTVTKQIKLAPASTSLPVTKVELPTTTAEQYQDLLLEQLAAFKGGKVRIKGAKRCERLVVFVDDLDRLSAEEMVNGLDAIRTFMEIPEADLPEGLGLVFVISCDEERVAHALDRGRRHADLPGSVFNRADARRFLDRIFQFRLEIPPFPRRDMRDYALSRLREVGLEALGEEELRAIVEAMIHVGVQSPRNAIQIVNAFAQSWWLARRRERSEAGSARPGALYDGSVTGHPLTLAAVCALRVDFPSFYSDVQQQQDLIQRFSDVAFREVAFDDLPESTREILAKYFQKRQSNGDLGTHGPKVNADHRGLRRYLASLQNHRWPRSIQPFLLLSQDAVSRKYGDAKHSMLEALVSGDVEGVLEALGRGADDKPLLTGDVYLLKEMTEDLSDEAGARRQAASFVLASLADRMPGDSARLLVAPLTRELQSSTELRWRLGISKIRALLPLAESQDQRSLAASLIYDNLSEGHPLQFRLQTGEAPSLDEAMGIARETVECVLQIQSEHGIPTPADSEFRAWLLSRSVRVGVGEPQSLPFVELHAWVKLHPDSLLQFLEAGYTDQLISELETESIDGVSLDEGIEYARIVFVELERSGEESRVTLWGQLGRLAAVRSGRAVHLAWETLLRFVGRPDPSAFSLVVGQLAARLAKEVEEPEEWELDWESGGEALLAIVESRPDDRSTEAEAIFQSLVESWSAISETGEFAVRGLRTLSGEARQDVLDSWITRLLSELPAACLDEVARVFETLVASQQEEVAAQLQAAVVTPTVVAKEVADSYDRFVGALSAAAWRVESLQGHLTELLTVIGKRHNNPDGYLSALFPTVVGILPRAEPASVGSMLHTLFSNAKVQPAHYSWLHFCMSKAWPAKAEELGAYDPEAIFNDAAAFAEANPKNTKQGLLSSMRFMIDRGHVSADREVDVADAACSSWSSSPKHAAASLTSLRVPPSPEQAAELMAPVDWEEAEVVTQLTEVWKHVASLQDLSQRSESLGHILQHGTVGGGDDALLLWLQLCPDAGAVLLTCLEGAEIEDEGTARLWRAAVRLRTLLGADFFRSALRLLLARPESAATVRCIEESREDLAGLFGSADEKARLADVLLKDGFLQSPSSTAKGVAAKWAKELNGHAQVKALSAGDLSLDDISILETHFGISTTRKLRRQVEKRVNRDAAE